MKEEVLQTTSNNNILHSLNIINQDEFDVAWKAGYNFTHFEHVQVGIQPLHKKGQDVASFSCIFDRQWRAFPKTLISGCQGTLAYGPASWSCVPDFSIPLSDPNAINSLMLRLQTHGYDDFDDDSKNIAIWRSSVVKFYKKTAPSVVKSASSQSEVTIITHDYGMNLITLQMIPKAALKPPT